MKAGPITLAVLASGGGRTLQNLIDVIGAGELDARIAVVIASGPDAGALQRAARQRVMNFVVERKRFATAEEFSAPVFQLCDDAGADLVCLAGWLSMLVAPERYQNRVMNIHPALLPSFGGKGLYGANVHKAVLEHGCKVSGCTVHYIDEKYDSGPIILQRACPVMEDDTPETLAERVFEEEKLAYPEAIRLHQQGRLKVEGRRVRVLPG